MSNEQLLPLFCVAANHAPCDSWQTHREVLDLVDKYIHHLIATIPDSIATGKAVQKASQQGQTSLTEEVPEVQTTVPDHRDTTLEPVVVHWFTESNGEEDWWKTNDKNIGRQVQYYREDCRKESILAYKPRGVLVYFDGGPRLLERMAMNDNGMKFRVRHRAEDLAYYGLKDGIPFHVYDTVWIPEHPTDYNRYMEAAHLEFVGQYVYPEGVEFRGWKTGITSVRIDKFEEIPE